MTFKLSGRAEIEIQRRGRKTYLFVGEGLALGELTWDQDRLPEQAFYTVSDQRYQIVGTGPPRRRTIRVSTGGAEIAAMEMNSTCGSIITQEGRLYSIERSIVRRSTVVKRQVGPELILVLHRRRPARPRIMTVYPSGCDASELHAILGATVYHAIRRESF